MKRLLIASALLLLCPALAFAQEFEQPIDFIRFDPATVRENEPFEILIGGLWPSGVRPSGPKVTIEDDRILIKMGASTEGPLAVEKWGERIRLGGLPAGNYRVEVDVTAESDNTFLTIAPKPFTLLPSYTLAGEDVLIEGVPLRSCTGPLICGPVRVFFGSNEATNVRLPGDGTILVRVPAGSGRVDVRVRNGDGTESVLPDSFTYTTVNGDPSQFDRVLIPMTFAGPGAHGSLWRSETIIRNDSRVTIDVEPLLPDNTSSIAAGARARMRELPLDVGGYLYVSRDADKWLTYSSHIADRSRSAIDRGSELPIVRAEDTSADIRLLDIPLRPLYRAKLRIYDFDSVRPHFVTIDIVKEDGTRVQVERQLPGNVLGPCAGPCFPHHPAYATVDLSSIPELANAGDVDISVRAETNDARLWAFVSVSNNQTQHVTMYTPQHKGGEVVR